MKDELRKQIGGRLDKDHEKVGPKLPLGLRCETVMLAREQKPGEGGLTSTTIGFAL